MHLIDTHFHLDYYKDHRYWYEEINRLQQYTLCVTNTPEVYYSCRKIYPETKYVKFALGYNPQQSVHTAFSKNMFLHEFCTTRYIGEVGLDFSPKYICTKSIQLDAFEFICYKSAPANKLLNIHSRMADEETWRMLCKHGVSRAIIHWYTGSIENMYRLLDVGCYFSANASMCTTPKGRNILAHIPIDRLLIESDGPFSKVSSQKYIPLDLQRTYDIIGETTGIVGIAQTVYTNFKHLLSD